jgi:hypothetical protein
LLNQLEIRTQQLLPPSQNSYFSALLDFAS